MPMTFDTTKLPDLTASVPDMAAEVMDKFFLKAKTAAARAVAADDIGVLSEDEKLAIALCAGCEVETSGAMDDGRLTYRTRNPVGFAIVNGRVQVFERRDDVLCERIER